MNMEFYQTMRMFLDMIVEKNLPPTITARTLFILPSTVIVGLSSATNVKLLEDYNLKYEHTKLNLSSEEINLLISYLTLQALQLVNRDFHSKIVENYINKNSNQVKIDFISQDNIQNIIYEMTYYYNQRNKDGWKDANKQIILPNDNYIKVNEPLNQNNFMNPQAWCPLQGQKMLGAKWGKVKSILSDKNVDKINKYINKEIKDVDIKSECKKVFEQSLILTDKEKMIAEFWAGIGGSVTPPGFFNMFLYGYFLSNPNTNLTQLEYFYTLNTGLFQASIIVWGAKYKFIQCRPIQSIRLNYPDIPIDYYFGKSNSSVWKPYQEARLWTPPFPDYISGHSTFSSVASCILTKLLGSNISSLNIILSKKDMVILSPIFKSSNFTKMDISNILISPNTSDIQTSVPKNEIILNYSTWNDMAESAGISRIYGGIHYPSSNTIALNVGKMICKKIFK